MTLNSKKLFWCKSCLNNSLRPRIEFDKKGICNACQWMKEKKTLNGAQEKTNLKK